MTREQFEREAEKLKRQCADRRNIGDYARKHSAAERIRLRRLARRVHAISEADMVSSNDKFLMRQLRKDGFTIDELADKFETCNLTVVLVVDYLLD